MDWFALQLLAWYAQHGRTDLPWQQDINPYRVWVSEIMLQQTQVTTVIDYYLRFMGRFENTHSLARAPLDEVLHHWTGLGYYARARNLHKAANLVVEQYNGVLPQSQAELEALPGIGRSTAGAIRAISMQQHATILDGNVKRVLSRFHAVEGYPGITQVAKTLWAHAETHTPANDTGAYTQAIMDLGATLCVRRRPVCENCPVQTQCEAKALNAVEKYPTSKPKKAKPVRRSRFYVVSLENKATLLEQKPLNGLWGGLWTPLEREVDLTLTDFLGELGLTETDLHAHHVAPSFRHTFTHFHLDIEPVYLQLASTPTLVEDNPSLRWVRPDQLNGENNPIGLSAPAVRLLASLQEPFQT
jgi:A/G-specific adenine glycosylase